MHAETPHLRPVARPRLPRKIAYRYMTAVAAAFASVTGATYAAGPAGSSPYPPRPKPAIALADFNAIEGKWVCSGMMSSGAVAAGSAATNYRSAIRIKPLFGGLSYEVRYEQRFSAHDFMVFAGTWYIGWDAARHELYTLWLDDMGTVAREHSRGWAAGKLVLTGQGVVVVPTPDGEASRAALLRDTFTRLAVGKLEWRGEMKLGGNLRWKVLGDDSCVRR